MGCIRETHYYVVGQTVVRRATEHGPDGLVSESILMLGDLSASTT